MSDLHNFNAGRKSWKMYAKELTSKDGDDLTITPYAGEDLILEVSGNGNILFKEDGITYNLADLSNNLIPNLTIYDDASLNNVDISGSLLINGINSRMPAEVENSLRKYLPLNHGQTDTTNTQTFMDIANDLSSNLLTSNRDAYFNNVNITTKLTGPSTFVIDPAAVGDNTGLVVIKGGLQIDGSSTIINSSIVDISDHQLLLAANAPNLSATDGAGIDISGGASFKYRYISGLFDAGHWESNIGLSCETINTQHIKNASKIVITTANDGLEIENTGIANTFLNSYGSNYITGTLNWISSLGGGLHLDTYGTGTESGVRIKNRGFTTTYSDTIFNYNNAGENFIRGSVNYINSFTNGLYLNAFGSGANSTIKMLAEGTGTNSGVQILNGAGNNGASVFNYDNSGQNFIRGTKLDVGVAEILLNATTNDGYIRLQSQGTGTNSGVQIINSNGTINSTIFNYNNSASNIIHGTTRFGNDIHIQKIIDASNSTGDAGYVLMSQGTGAPNIWSNNPSLPNYLYMGSATNVGVSGQVLVSQYPSGFPTWTSLAGTTSSTTLAGTTFTGDVSMNANLNFDRATNNTSLVRFTSSTEIDNVRRQTPIIHVGDIEIGGGAGGRMGFDFKFREGGINSSTYTLFRAYSTSTTGNGQFQVFGATYSAQGWNTSSDDRFKHGEYNIANGLETIRNLVPKTYKKSIEMLDADNDGTNIGIEGEDWYWESGLIAQEIEKIPTLSNYVKELDNKKYVSYNNIHIHTISAVKELDTIVQQQAQLITSLEARLLALESK